MKRRLVITAVAATALAGAVVPSFASSGPGSPVGVQVDTSNGVSAGVTVLGQPGAGASATQDGRVCAGISEQVPQCAGPIDGSTHQSRQSLPAAVQHDDSGTTVIVGEVGVHVSPDGQVCPLVSTQSWQCVGGGVDNG